MDPMWTTGNVLPERQINDRGHVRGMTFRDFFEHENVKVNRIFFHGLF